MRNDAVYRVKKSFETVESSTTVTDNLFTLVEFYFRRIFREAVMRPLRRDNASKLFRRAGILSLNLDRLLSRLLKIEEEENGTVKNAE